MLLEHALLPLDLLELALLLLQLQLSLLLLLVVGRRHTLTSSSRRIQSLFLILLVVGGCG
mgnify:FL=1